MIGTRSQQIFNVRSTLPNFSGCPLYVFGVLHCHTRTSWQCLSWCNLRIAERIAGGRSATPHPRCAQRQGQRSPDMGNFVVALKLLLVVAKRTDHH